MSTKKPERQLSNMAMNDAKIYQMMRYAMKHPKDGVDIKDFIGIAARPPNTHAPDWVWENVVQPLSREPDPVWTYKFSDSLKKYLDDDRTPKNKVHPDRLEDGDIMIYIKTLPDEYDKWSLLNPDKSTTQAKTNGKPKTPCSDHKIGPAGYCLKCGGT